MNALSSWRQLDHKTIRSFGYGFLLVAWCLVGYWAYQSYHQTLQISYSLLSQSVSVLKEQTSQTLSLLRISLISADHWLATHHQVSPENNQEFGDLVDSLRQASGHRTDIRLVSEDARLIYVPQRKDAAVTTVSDREYFLVQQDPKTRGFHIGAPLVSRITKEWGIPISIPASRNGGGISVLFGALELRTLSKLQTPLVTKPSELLTLVRSDGVILSTTPLREDFIGKSIVSEEEWTHLSAAANGVFTLEDAPSDHQRRIVAFDRLDEFGVIVIRSVTEAEVLTPWIQQLSKLSLIVLLMSVVFTALMERLARSTQALKVAMEEVARNEKRLHTIIDASPVPKALVDRSDHVAYLNPAFVECFGYTLDDVSTVTDWQRLGYPDVSQHAEAYRFWRDEMAAAALREKDGPTLERQIRCKDGSYRTVMISAKSITLDGDASLMVTFHDITELKHAEAALRRSEERYRELVESANEGIAVVQGANIQFVNPKFLEIFGVKSADVLSLPFVNVIYPEDRELVLGRHQRRLAGGQEPTRYSFRISNPQSGLRWVELNVADFEWDTRPATLCFFTDITDRHEAEKKVRRLAFHDGLTELPNRRLLDDRLEQAVALSARQHKKLSLLFIDLDKFKPINDQLGHDVGDWLLKQVARRLLAAVRASDTVARIGGDEFIVLLHDADQVDHAVGVGEKIRQALNEPFVTDDGKSLNISCSIGIVVYPDHAATGTDLLRLGDKAMYRAKKEGRNAVKVFMR